MNKSKLDELLRLSKNNYSATTEEVVRTWRLIKELVNELVLDSKYQQTIGDDLTTPMKAIHTKFNDAGRRSAPWRIFEEDTSHPKTVRMAIK